MTLGAPLKDQTVAFYTLGCKTNQLESSAIADEFRTHGWHVVPFEEGASVSVINTCTVTEDGDRESRRIVRKAKRLNPKGRVAVTGCYAQVAPHAVAAVEGVNYVIGNNFKQDIFKIIETTKPLDHEPFIQVSEMDKSRIMAGASLSAINRSRASLKIQDGCDFKCTYCIIWVARGPSRSLSIETITTQLQALIGEGHHEVMLTGINIGQYEDPETGKDLAGLLNDLSNIDGNFRLRLTSLDPAEITTQLLDVLKDNPKICPHIHLSLQAAQDDVLKRMARRHRSDDIIRVCDALMSVNPDMAIGTDIITGFPEESDDKFDFGYHVLSQLPLSYIHAFTYSAREGTPAASFDDQIPHEVRKERTHRLLTLSEQQNLAYRSRFLNKEAYVIVEDNRIKGMSEYYFPVMLDRDDLPKQSLVKVKINRVEQDATYGKVIS